MADVKDSDGYSPGDFLVVEDHDKPSTWHLQVKKNGKPDHGLMGAAWAALFSPGGHRGNKYEGPNISEAKTALKALYKSEGMEEPSADHSVSFDAELPADPLADGEMVVRMGKLFQLGEYPDKDFEFDSEDLDNAIAAFTPVPVDLEHTPTVLEGKLGQVLSISAGPDGSVMGEVELPLWLDKLLDAGERKVSASWDRATKTLNRLALVRNPRVSDAALMAAFSEAETDFARKRHDTPSGQMAIQQLHNLAASSGAVCNQPATMASRHEHSAVQQIHDVAVSHGATCASLASTMNPVNPTYFSGAPASPKPTKILHRRPRMNIREWLTGKATEEGVEIEDLEAAFSGANPELEAKIKSDMDAKDAKIVALEEAQKVGAAHFARLADERRQTEAVTFASGLVAAKRIAPVAAEKLAPLAARIAAADSGANFGQDEKSTSVLLQEFCDALPDLSIFTTESIASDKHAALFNSLTTEGVSKPNTPTPERIDALLKTTASGRAVLAERAKSNGH